MDEIADREANQTFFGFLNTEPAVDRPTSKRVKSRPASVGSLGSMVVSSSPSLTTTNILKESKKSQLKTRAVSAIMTSSNMIPKKIKPSQSMPLSKKQQLLQKKSAPRKNSATPASTTTYDDTNTNATTTNATAHANATTVSASSSPTTTTDIEHDDNTLYSSTAYINSNITLNKAFKPQRGNSQMASMIPIATRTQLITTKSL